jgi:hypothetical protein
MTKRILVVEHQWDNRQIVRDLLTANDFDRAVWRDNCASDSWRATPSIRSNLVFGSDTLSKDAQAAAGCKDRDHVLVGHADAAGRNRPPNTIMHRGCTDSASPRESGRIEFSGTISEFSVSIDLSPR